MVNEFSFTRRSLVIASAVFVTMAALILGSAVFAVCVPTSYTATTSMPTVNWTDTSFLWTPAGGYPGCAPGDSASITPIGPLPPTIIINSSIPNPIIGLNFAFNGAVIELQPSGHLTIAGPATVGSGSKIKMNGGTLTIANGGTLTFQSGSTFEFLGGTLDVQTGGQVNLDGANTVTGGGVVTISGGTLNVPPTASIAFQNGTQLVLSAGSIAGGGTVSNAGSMQNFSAGAFTVNAVLNNLPGGTVNVFTGTLSLAAGGTGDAPFTIDGNARLDFPSGSYTMTPNGVVSGAGTLAITGGTLSIGGVTSPEGFLLSAGTMTGAGFLSVKNLSWSGGTMTGTGGSELAGSGTGTIDGSDGAMTLDRAFNDYGTLNYTATSNSLTLINSAVISVYGGFNILSDGDIFGTTPAAFNVFPNGQLVKSGTAGTSIIQPPMTNNSTVFADTGTLELSGGGTHTGFFGTSFGATIAFTGGTTNLDGFNVGDGTFAFSSGTTNINSTFSTATMSIGGGASVNLTVDADCDDFVFDGGTFNLGAAFSMFGPGSWSDGTIAGTGGPFIVENGALFVIDASTGMPLLNNAKIKNNGEIDYTASSPRYLTMQDGAIIENNGLFDLQRDQPIVATTGVIIGFGGVLAQASSFPLFDNTSGGTLKKTCCLASTDIQPDLSNAGSILALSGTISVGGAFSQTAGSTTLGPGSVASSSTFNMSGGELNGAGTFTGSVSNGGIVSPGSSPGVITITGSYTQTSSGTLSIEIGGPSAGQFDQLNVLGIANLDGTFTATLINSYIPANGTTWSPLTYAGGHSGVFATQNLPTYPIGGSIVSATNGNSFDLTAVTPAQANLAITKNGPAGVVAGQNVVYTVTVTNNGPDAAAGVTVADPQPANLTFVSNSGDCTGNYPCNLGTMSNGQVRTITSTYSTSPSFSGNVINTATVSSSTNDPNNSDNSASATTNVGAQADLAISKSGPASVNPGQNVVYTVVVTNNGPSPATGVTVSDPTPVGLAFQSNTNSCGTPYPCSLGTLNAGQSVTITSTYTVPNNYASASISNTATVSSAVNDPNLADNSSTASTTVTQTADLSISKSGPSSIGKGQNIVYTIAVTNLGPSTAPAPTVSDTPSPGLTFVSNSGACNTPFPCSLPALSSGQSVTITSTFNVPVSYPNPTVTNTASVSSSASDPASGNNSATVNTPVVADADLSVSKTGPSTTGTGQNVVFTIVVTNNGTLTANNAVLSDPTPPGLTFVSNSGACNTPFPCALGVLTPGQIVTITSTFNVPANYAGGAINNTATVSSATTDLNSSNNSSTATVLLGAVADVRVTKSGPATLVEGAPLVYTIAVTNSGPAAASNIVVSDPTPPGLLFVSNSGACVTPFPCTIASLNANQTATITATYTNQYPAGGVVVNEVSITSAADPQQGNNKSTATTLITSGTVCPQPAKLIAPIGGVKVSSPVAFSWGAVPGAVGYTLTILGGPAPVTINTSNLSAGATLPAGAYTWTITAFGIPACNPVTSSAAAFVVCGAPATPVASVIGQSTSGQTYAVEWNEIADAVGYELQESGEATFANPSVTNLTGTSKSFTKDVGVGAAFYYRVRATSPCGVAGEFSPVIHVAVLPVPAIGNDANISVPAGSTTPVAFNIFVPGLPGVTTSFVATVDKPWLSVIPTSGIVPPEGVLLTVQTDPTGLPNGTWTGTILVVYGSAGVTGSDVGIAANPPTKSIPVSISLVTPVTPVGLPSPSNSAMVVPSVGHLAGIESNWRSDVRVANVGASPQKYQLTLSGGSDPSALVKQTTMSVDAGSTVALDDIVRTWYGVGSLGESGNGILIIQPVDAGGRILPQAVTIATSAPVVASRTFNAAATGTLGQFIPAVPFGAFIGSGANLKSILSLQQIAQNETYRTNLGVIEAAGKPVTAVASVYDAGGTKLLDVPLSLAGGEQKQLNGFLAQNNLTLPNGRIEVKVLGGAGRLSAYASVIDNRTKDPLYVSGAPVGGAGSSRFVLPGVAALDNATANWRSDLRLFNSGAAPVNATLTFYPAGDPAAKVTQQVTINPSEVKAVDNALQSLFGIHDAGGALHVTTATDAPLVITARTYDQTATGTIGQFIPAVTLDQATGSTERPLQILQVEESPRYRANIGLAEMSGKPATVEVSVVLPDSKIIPKVQFTLNAFEFRQLPILSSLGVGAVYNARVTVRVVSGEGKVTGYASVIDRATGDPTYIQAQ
jgi:uncharacterized repeat protein (TIGR01451 family)